MTPRWLFQQVHGRMPARAPRRRRSARAPIRDWKYRAWVRSFQCLVCRTGRLIEAAHTGDHGIGQKASDRGVVPLCAVCHRVGAQSYHVLGRGAFELAHGLDLAEVVRTLNLQWKLAKDEAA